MQLQIFGPAFGQLDPSPFCLKAICLLNMAGVSWTSVPNSDVRKTPVGKLPVLIDGSQVIHDSDRIRAYLETHYNADFDKGLNPVQRAHSRSIIRMVEEHLYFCLVYDRWVPDASWAHIKNTFFGDLPPIVRKIVPPIVRKSVVSSVRGQGIGRLSYQEMLERAKLDLAAIEDLLGDRNFLFGDELHAADVSSASVLVNMAASPQTSGLRECVRDNQTLVQYADRVLKKVTTPAQ